MNMSTIERPKRARSTVDKPTSLELLASALGYLRGAGFSVRASNISLGLAIVIEGATIDASGQIMVNDLPVNHDLPVVANDSLATTGK